MSGLPSRDVIHTQLVLVVRASKTLNWGLQMANDSNHILTNSGKACYKKIWIYVCILSSLPDTAQKLFPDDPTNRASGVYLTRTGERSDGAFSQGAWPSPRRMPPVISLECLIVWSITTVLVSCTRLAAEQEGDGL